MPKIENKSKVIPSEKPNASSPDYSDPPALKKLDYPPPEKMRELMRYVATLQKMGVTKNLAADQPQDETGTDQ